MLKGTLRLNARRFGVGDLLEAFEMDFGRPLKCGSKAFKGFDSIGLQKPWTTMVGLVARGRERRMEKVERWM